MSSKNSNSLITLFLTIEELEKIVERMENSNLNYGWGLYENGIYKEEELYKRLIRIIKTYRKKDN